MCQVKRAAKAFYETLHVNGMAPIPSGRSSLVSDDDTAFSDSTSEGSDSDSGNDSDYPRDLGTVKEDEVEDL